MIPVMIIPTLSQRDRLVEQIASFDYPIGQLVIVDNGRYWPRYQALNLPTPPACVQQLQVIELPANLGVAGAWNLGIKVTPYAPWWLICNDDLLWPAGALAQVAAAVQPGRLTKYEFYSAFSVPDDVIARVGLFDERYHPGYGEDDDYDDRLQTAGIPVVTVPVGVHHAVRSSTARGTLNAHAFTQAANNAWRDEKQRNQDRSWSWDLLRRRALGWDNAQPTQPAIRAALPQWSDLTAPELELAQRLPGTWVYSVRPGTRAVTLEAGGRIGRGGADCERRWLLKLDNGVPTLWVIGDETHSTDPVVMQMTMSRDGIWRGRWRNRERWVTVWTPPAGSDGVPHWWQSRPNIWDRNIYVSVVNNDEYRIGSVDLVGQAVVDVGAHMGAFTWAAWRAGATTIHAYEAGAENRRLLQANAAFLPGVTVHPEALGPVSGQRLRYRPPKGDGETVNTGGGSVKAAKDGELESSSLDDVLLRVGRRVRLLKLDCEGCERAVVPAAKRLDLVDRIAAEFHGAGCSVELPAYLRTQGFRVDVRPTGDQIGLLWAWR